MNYDVEHDRDIYNPNSMQIGSAVLGEDRFRTDRRFRDRYPALYFLLLLSLLGGTAVGIVMVLR